MTTASATTTSATAAAPPYSMSVEDAVPAAGLCADAVSPTAAPWLLELLVLVLVLVLVLLPPPLATIATETVGDTVGCVDDETWASVGGGGGGRGGFGFGGAATGSDSDAVGPADGCALAGRFFFGGGGSGGDGSGGDVVSCCSVGVDVGPTVIDTPGAGGGGERGDCFCSGGDVFVGVGGWVGDRPDTTATTVALLSSSSLCRPKVSSVTLTSCPVPVFENVM
jgi:hypothetical protein